MTYRVISADSTRWPARTPSSSANGGLVPSGAAGDPGPHGSRGPLRPAAVPLGRLRRPRPGRGGAGARAAVLARRLGVGAAAPAGDVGSGRGRRRRLGASCSRAPTRRRAGPAPCSTRAAERDAGLRGRPGRCWSGSCSRSRSRCAAAGLASRRGCPRPAGVVGRRCPAAGARGQHRRASATRWRGVAGPGHRRHRGARRGDGGLAGRPRRPAAAVLRPEVPAGRGRRRGAPVLADRLRLGGRAGRQRHGAGGARGRVADRAVRDRLRLGARGQAGAGRRGAGRGRGVARVGAAAPRRPPVPARRTPQPHRARVRRRSGDDADGRRGVAAAAAARRQRRPRARPSTCRRCAARCSSRSPSPPSSSRCRRSWSACPRRGRRSPSRSTRCCRCRAPPGRPGSVQVSIDPARPGANTLHLYLFDDAGRLTQPAAITVSLTEPSQQIGPLDVKLQPGGPGHYIADGMDIPAPAPGPSPSPCGSTSSPPPPPAPTSRCGSPR